MEASSSAEVFSVGDGTTQLAFDLSECEVRYFIVSKPTRSDIAAREFFGSDHYVEVKDQLFGRYGGLERLEVLSDRQVKVHLVHEVPGVGRTLSIRTARPMTDQALDHLRSLER